MIVFISAWKAGRYDIIENTANTANLQRDLQKLGLNPELVLGVYQGETEQSWAVSVRNGDTTTLKAIELLAKHYEQQAIMIVNSNMETTLMYADGMFDYLGKLVDVGKNPQDVIYNTCASYWRGEVWVTHKF